MDDKLQTTENKTRSSFYKILDATKLYSAKFTYYASILGTLSILLAERDPSTLPPTLAVIAGGIGVNLISNLIERGARGESLDEDEILETLRLAINSSKIENALTKAEFRNEFDRFTGDLSLQIINQTIIHGYQEIALSLIQQNEQNGVLREELRSEFASLRKELEKSTSTLSKMIPTTSYTEDKTLSGSRGITINKKIYWKGNPYPGLRSFSSKESKIFFGREYEVGGLIDRLKTNNFICVIGASGSGKSSLIRAGLLPRLMHNVIPNSKKWIYISINPGASNASPFDPLSRGIIDKVQGTKDRFFNSFQMVTNLSDNLAKYPSCLEETINYELKNKPDCKVLLFIDQFEELFTHFDVFEIRAFVNMVVRSVKSARIKIIISLRADFYKYCLRFPEFAKLLQSNSFPLSTPKLRNLYEMIINPAQIAGLEFEIGLTGRILEDTKSEPGSLALLAFGLYQLYEESKPFALLSNDAYDRFGGITGAIGIQATKAFDELEDEAKLCFSKVFRELVDVDERGLPTKRRLELLSVELESPEMKLVSKLTEHRLLVQTQNDQGNAVIEIAHEALFDSWSQLKEWIDQRNDDLKFGGELIRLAIRWKNNNKNDAYLLPVIDLGKASAWKARAIEKQILRAEQEEYIISSIAHHKKQEKRSKRNRSMVIISLVFISVLFAGFSILSGFLASQRNKVIKEKEMELVRSLKNESSYLASLSSKELLSGSPQNALILALESLQHFEEGIWNADGIDALRNSLGSPVQEISYLLPGEIDPFPKPNVIWDDGIAKAMTFHDNRLSIWDISGSNKIMNLYHQTSLSDATWLADGDKIVSWDLYIAEDAITNFGNIYLWNASTGEKIYSKHFTEGPFTVKIDSKQNFAAAQTNNSILILNLDSGEEKIEIPIESWIQDIEWSSDDSFILGWSSSQYDETCIKDCGSTITIWDIHSGQSVFSMELENADLVDVYFIDKNTPLILSYQSHNCGENCIGFMRSYDFNNDESIMFGNSSDVVSISDIKWNRKHSKFIIRGGDGSAGIIDIVNKNEPINLSHDGYQINGAIWNSSGDRVLSWGSDGSIREWDALTGKQLLILRHDGVVNGAAWNKDEQLIYSWSDDRNFRIWNRSNGKIVATLNHDLGVEGALWNVDENLIVTWTNKAYKIWEINHIRSDISTQTFHTNITNSPIFSDDKSKVLVTTRNGIYIVDLKTNSQLLHIEYKNGIDSAFWNYDESVIVGYSNDLTIHKWNANNGNELLTINVNNFQDPNIDGIRLNKDGTKLLSWTQDGITHLWDFIDGSLLLTIKHPFESNEEMTQDAFFMGAQWNVDESQIITYNWFGSIRVWDPNTGKELYLINDEPGTNKCNILVPNPDNSMILCWGGNNYDQNEIWVWNSSTWEEILHIQHENWIENVVWNQDGSKILSWTIHGKIYLWQVKDGQSIQFIDARLDPNSTPKYTPTNMVRFNDYYLSAVSAGNPRTASVLWSSDENKLLTSTDAGVKIWSIESGKELIKLIYTPEAAITSTSNEPTNLEWNSEGSQAMMMFNDRLRIWDSISGNLLMNINISPNDLVSILKLGTNDASSVLESGIDDASWILNDEYLLITYGNSLLIVCVDEHELLEMGEELVIRDLTNEDQTRLLVSLPMLLNQDKRNTETPSGITHYSGSTNNYQYQKHSFYGKSGDNITIKFNLNSYNEDESTHNEVLESAYLYLYDPNGKLLAENGIRFIEDGQRQIDGKIVCIAFDNLLLPITGNYKISLSNWYTDDGGLYEFVLETIRNINE